MSERRHPAEDPIDAAIESLVPALTSADSEERNNAFQAIRLLHDARCYAKRALKEPADA